MSKSKTASAEDSDKVNKSHFVRSFPHHMPAKEIVAKGKSRGIKLSVAYVYSIRAAANRRERQRTGELARRGRPPKGGNAPGRVEDLLRAVAAEIGLSRAISLLEAEQRKVRAVLGPR